ncbi:MAG: zinc-binding alcohol dehydrogenase family protein [Cyanobium sp.]
MRAIVAESAAASGPDQAPALRPLREIELPLPELRPHDLLVRVEAVAVNPVDTKVRAALAAGAAPRVLGWDAAGCVEAVGSAVRRFRPGDAVIAAGDITRPGCYAQWLAVDERITGRRPRGSSWAEAAALPLTGLTAWEALFERLGLDPEGGDAGRSLLIIGGAGGVGSLAIQLARRAGLLVIATASRPESTAWVRELGADHVLDHSRDLAPQLAELGLETVDRIANFADTDAYWDVMAALIRPQGAIVAIVGNRQPLDLDRLKSKSASFHWEFMFTRPRYGTPDLARQGEILERLADRIELGVLRSTLRTQLGPITAQNLERAHALLERRQTIGKIVLQGWGGPGGASGG